jgi:IS5 family transposase
MHAIESKAQPSPPEPTMRQERTIQATIFEVFAGHEIGCELKAISQWLDRQRALMSLVAGDLRRHGLRETGRRGLPAEAVLRCALLKQQRQLSYEELAFHLEDSASFRAFCPLAAGLVAEKIGAAPDDQCDPAGDLGSGQSGGVGQRQTGQAGKRRHGADRQYGHRGADA